jgi:putative addiction module component (TIGR02574 family)
MSIQEIEQLSNAEKILLVERIWNNISKQEIPLTDAQRKELDRRLEKHQAGENEYRNWDEVKQKLQNPPLG